MTNRKLHLFGQLKRIARQWLDGYLVCKGGTYPAQLKYKMLADMACERITAGITARLRSASARSWPYSTPTTRSAPPPSQLQHQSRPTAGKPTPAAVTSTG